MGDHKVNKETIDRRRAMIAGKFSLSESASKDMDAIKNTISTMIDLTIAASRGKSGSALAEENLVISAQALKDILCQGVIFPVAKAKELPSVEVTFEEASKAFAKGIGEIVQSDRFSEEIFLQSKGDIESFLSNCQKIWES